jgi:hypothetical protein
VGPVRGQLGLAAQVGDVGTAIWAG